jgi:hypothetical protein
MAGIRVALKTKQGGRPLACQFDKLGSLNNRFGEIELAAVNLGKPRMIALAGGFTTFGRRAERLEACIADPDLLQGRRQDIFGKARRRESGTARTSARTATPAWLRALINSAWLRPHSQW